VPLVPSLPSPFKASHRHRNWWPAEQKWYPRSIQKDAMPHAM
jgi:antitoxin Phd